MLALDFNSLSYTHETDETRRMAATKYFERSREQAVFGQLKAFFGRSQRMPSLSERIAGRAVRGQHSLGQRTVDLEKITGTESRADDFDAAFHPRSDRTRDRWVNIASLHLRHAALPAVELIQVGSEYFVRDGHHRISVARALGKAYIDARVTVLEV